jgi:hypothetical protein
LLQESKVVEAERLLMDLAEEAKNKERLAQRDLSVAYNNIGDMQKAQGDLKAALNSRAPRRPAMRLRRAAQSLGIWWGNTPIRRNGNKTWLGLTHRLSSWGRFHNKKKPARR